MGRTLGKIAELTLGLDVPLTSREPKMFASSINAQDRNSEACFQRKGASREPI